MDDYYGLFGVPTKGPLVEPFIFNQLLKERKMTGWWEEVTQTSSDMMEVRYGSSM